MNDTISKYVKRCVLCGISESRKMKLGLYTPLPLPSQPWESVSMDFVGGFTFPRSSHDYLHVVVNSFSKMCILMPCKKQVTTEQTTLLLFKNVWVHFGLHTSIVSGQDS